MINVVRMQQLIGLKLILACLCFTSGLISTLGSSFEDLCRYQGLCLNCSEGGCDDMCNFYNNSCCVNFSATNTLLKKWQFSCVRKFPDMYDLHLDCRGSFDGVYGVYMVTKCSESWSDAFIKSNCEDPSENDLISKIPVFDTANEIVTYKNVYCAICNQLALGRIEFWTFDLMCNKVQENEPGYGQCFIRLKYRKHRMCAMDVIEECNLTANVEPSLRERCMNGLSQNVYVWEGRHRYKVYKNEFCAQCNYETGDLQCWAFQAFTCWPEDLPPYNNVKAMTDLTLHGHRKTDSVELFNNRCGEGVLFDPFKDKCLNVTCLSLHDTCISGRCHLVKIADSDFMIRNNSSLYFFALEVFIPEGRYFIKDLEFHACLDDSQYRKFEMTKPTTKHQLSTDVVNVTEGRSTSRSSGKNTSSLVLLFFLFFSC